MIFALPIAIHFPNFKKSLIFPCFAHCIYGIFSKESHENETNEYRRNQQTSLHDSGGNMTVANVSATAKDVPERFLYDVEGELDTELIKRGLLAVKDANGANKVYVDITYYRMRNGAARVMAGVLAGKDGVEGKVTVMDPNGKRIAILDASSFDVLAGSGPDYIAHTFAQRIVTTLEKHIDSVKNR